MEAICRAAETQSSRSDRSEAKESRSDLTASRRRGRGARLAIDGRYGIFFAAHQIATIDLTGNPPVSPVL
jgi:hypothetical protein